MKAEEKDIVQWLVWAVTAGGLFEWFRGRVNQNRAEIKTLKKQMLTENQEPRFLTEPVHDKICARKTEVLAEIKDHQEKQDEKLEEILIAVTILTTEAKKGS